MSVRFSTQGPGFEIKDLVSRMFSEGLIFTRLLFFKFSLKDADATASTGHSATLGFRV